eukprot:SAG22_NODE_12903_length_425_cov_1.024540_2_plen_40_part_01
MQYVGAVPGHGIFALMCDGAENESTLDARCSWFRVARNTD